MSANSQQHHQETAEALFQALRLIGKFAEQSIGYVETWDTNEIVIRDVKTNNAITFIDLSEETPSSLLDKFNQLKIDESTS